MILLQGSLFVSRKLAVHPRFSAEKTKGKLPQMNAEERRLGHWHVASLMSNSRDRCLIQEIWAHLRESAAKRFFGQPGDRYGPWKGRTPEVLSDLF
jgi:hypothetical protein